MITQIEYFNSTALMIACLIAIVSIKIYKYRSIAAILAIQFLFLIGYDLLLPVDQVVNVIFTSLIYTLKLLIMIVFLIIYAYLGATLLAMTAGAIIRILSYSAFSSLYAITPLYYNELMQAAAIVQLIIGILGIFNGCRFFDKAHGNNIGQRRRNIANSGIAGHKK